MDQRNLIGWLGLTTLILGIVTLWFPPSFLTNTTMLAAALLRVGTLFCVIWLAYPDLKRIPKWIWAGLLVSVVVIAVRPRAALVLLPLLGIIAWLYRPARR